MRSSKRSIRKKIFTSILAMSIISLVILAFLSINSLYIIRDRTIKTSFDLGTYAENVSSDALETSAKNSLQAQLNNRVNTIDRQFTNLSGDIGFFFNYMNDLYKLNNSVPEFSKNIPFDKLKQPLGLNIDYSDGIDSQNLPERIKNEIQLVSGVFPAVDANQNNLNNFVSFQLISEYGFSIFKGSSEGHSDADFRQSSWYMRAKAINGTVWELLPSNTTGGKQIIACANPYYDSNGNMRGVIAFQVDISELKSLLVSINLGQRGRSFLIDQNANYILSSKEITEDPSNMGFSSAYLEGQDEYNTHITNMTTGISNFVEINFNDESCYMLYTPIHETNWSIAVIIPTATVRAPADSVSQNIETVTLYSLSDVNQAIFVTIVILISILILMLIIIYFISGKLSKQVSDPIIELTNSVFKIGTGDLDFKPTIKTNDEIETLSDTFYKMTVDLKSYIYNLQKATTEKERLGAELSIANKIQCSMLPCTFPPFPNRKDFDIFSTMLPAKEVGGDFYDFFFIDQNHLCVVIADVSGKGIPAALFMVVARTLIKNNAQMGLSPSEVLKKTNNQLYEGNDATMFVTAFIGILDTRTGEFVYANAGHNPPCLRRAEKEYEFMSIEADFVLAGVPDMEYTNGSVTLNAGDTLYLYTDGVTEATNAEQKLFTDDRLLSSLNKRKDANLRELLAGVKTDIDDFVKDAPQFDDITMLALKYYTSDFNQD